MKAGEKVRVRRGKNRGRVGVVRGVTKNHDGDDVTWVDFKDGISCQMLVSDLAEAGKGKANGKK